jgi:hypothetical protein
MTNSFSKVPCDRRVLMSSLVKHASKGNLRSCSVLQSNETHLLDHASLAGPTRVG